MRRRRTDGHTQHRLGPRQVLIGRNRDCSAHRYAASQLVVARQWRDGALPLPHAAISGSAGAWGGLPPEVGAVIELNAHGFPRVRSRTLPISVSLGASYAIVFTSSPLT